MLIQGNDFTVNSPITLSFNGGYDKYSFFTTGIDIEFMSELEQTFKVLPVDDDVVLKLPEGTVIESFNTTAFDASESPVYVSAKELNDEVLGPILDNFNNPDLVEQGVEVRLLEPGKKWVTGKICLRLLFEFIPDKPENNKTLGDDAMLGGHARPRSTDAVLGGQ